MSHVLYERDGRVARITLNRPEVLNAISLEMPMFLAGALVSVRMTGSMIADVFLAQTIATRERKKRAIAISKMAVLPDHDSKLREFKGSQKKFNWKLTGAGRCRNHHVVITFGHHVGHF